jgi:O-antigen/teichoic acid export membrane protein
MALSLQKLKLTDTTATAFGLTYQQIMSFITGVLIARMMGAAEYGTFSLVRNFTTISLSVLPLGLDIALLKYFPNIENQKLFIHKQFVAFRTVVACVSVAVMLAFWLAAPILQNHLYQIDHFSIYLVIVAAALPFMTDLALFSAYAKSFGYVRYYVLTTMVGQTTLRAIAVLLVLLYGGGTLGALLASTGASILTSVAVIVFYHSFARKNAQSAQLTPATSWREVQSTLKESIWMAFSVFIYPLMRSIDIFFLGVYCTSAIVGAYSSLSFISFVIFVVPLSLSQSIGPTISRCFQQQDFKKIYETFDRYIYKSCNASGFLLGGIAAFGSHLDLLLGHSFVVSPWLAFLLPAGQFASAVFGPTGFALSMTGWHKLELYLLLVGAALLVVLLYLLVPVYGAEGAAAASMFAYIATNIGRYILVRQKLGVWLGRWTSALPPICALFFAYFCQYVGEKIMGRNFLGVVIECLAYSVLFGLFFLVQSQYLKNRAVAYAE